MYWPQKRWRRAATVGQRLTVLFGGPHTSQPSFRRATVKPEDLLYPVGVHGQVLYVFGRMRVQEIIPVDGNEQPSPLDQYFGAHHVWQFLAPTCTTEVVIGAESTAIHLDRPVPGEILKRLTYRPRRGPRQIKHVSEDGRLVHALSVQGIYRLAESSAADLDAVLSGPPGAPAPITRLRPPRKSQDVPTNADTLF